MLFVCHTSVVTDGPQWSVVTIQASNIMTRLSTCGACQAMTVSCAPLGIRPSSCTLQWLMITVESYMNDVCDLTLPVPPYDVERMNRALLSYTTEGRQEAFNTMLASRGPNFNLVAVSTFPRRAREPILTASLTSTIRLCLKKSWSDKEVSTRTKRGNCSRNVHHKSCASHIFGRTSSSKPRTRLSDNTAKSTLPTLDKTRHSALPPWVVYELDKDQRDQTRKVVCLGTRSKIRKRLNVRHVQRGYRPCGGVHRERYLGIRCARIAGEHRSP